MSLEPPAPFSDGTPGRRLVWLTDLHLDWLNADQIVAFLREVHDAHGDAVVISGDIALPHLLHGCLRAFQGALPCPVYFVLGNHDFYGSSVRAVRARMAGLTRSEERLVWLSEDRVIPLSRSTALIGHDGWADGRSGDYERSEIVLTDYVTIAELKGLSKTARLGVLNRLGDEAAASLRRTLPRALEGHEHVVLAIHTPPFREACTFEGRVSGDEWLPHLCCTAAGPVLLDIMASRPDRRLTVLCGHTHGRGDVAIRENIRVLTGGAEYGKPEIQRVLEVK